MASQAVPRFWPRRSTARFWWIALVVCVLTPPRSAHAQEPLPELSLEELMQLDAGRVFGASERLQPVTEAPSSVSFITAEEIAYVVAFVASPKAVALNGDVIAAGGGAPGAIHY